MIPDFLTSNQKLSQTFADGLKEILEHEGLGVLVLVFANSVMKPGLYEALKQPLLERFNKSQETYRDLIMSGRKINDSDDDMLVFLKMLMVGYENIKLVEMKKQGVWELQFNHLRGFRPPRNSGSNTKGNHQPYNENGFHFNKPFLRKETIWHGQIAGKVVDLLYNKFPFLENHMLLVPEREHNASQYLTEDDHLFIWELCQQLADKINGWGIGYNSYGAYASVNHLHFQPFVRELPLPIEDPQWQHNGGDINYPVNVEVFTDLNESWKQLDKLNREGCSYNLLYRANKLYIINRRHQSEYKHSPWTAGFAWYEACGGTVTFNDEDYSSIDTKVFEEELKKLNSN
jgi:ATP adenylyltransferase/5',5'''-P-1,P-4-tetraphosphate phosphorylase II